jgi:hypothetical protein
LKKNKIFWEFVQIKKRIFIRDINELLKIVKKGEHNCKTENKNKIKIALTTYENINS